MKASKGHINSDRNSTIQAKAVNQANKSTILQAYMKGTTQLVSQEEETSQLEENKTGLPDNLKSGVENLSGQSLDDVKVHYNSSQPESLQAHAFAQGTDIHVAPGQEKHLPHEAWHVVQQKQGRVQPTRQLKGTTAINDDAGLEKEADVMGAKAVVQQKNKNDEKSEPLSENSISGSVSQLKPITRSISKILSETTPLKTQEDFDAISRFLTQRGYGDRLDEIVGRFMDGEFESEDVSNQDEDEEAINWIDHDDLYNYENEEGIDYYIQQHGITQFARKPGVVSGPKSYGSFKDVAYKTDDKGCIDFETTHGKPTSWSNPVKGDSEVDLSKAGKTINTKNRTQHFAIGDHLLSKSWYGKNAKASQITSYRKSKWTWHHLKDPYKMVLVNMEVHRKHGHNGGVHIW